MNLRSSCTSSTFGGGPPASPCPAPVANPLMPPRAKASRWMLRVEYKLSHHPGSATNPITAPSYLGLQLAVSPPQGARASGGGDPNTRAMEKLRCRGMRLKATKSSEQVRPGWRAIMGEAPLQCYTRSMLSRLKSLSGVEGCVRHRGQGEAPWAGERSPVRTASRESQGVALLTRSSLPHSPILTVPTTGNKRADSVCRSCRGLRPLFESASPKAGCPLQGYLCSCWSGA
jgi:hypothetical protein